MKQTQNQEKQIEGGQDDETRTYIVRLEPIVLEIDHGSAEEAEREAYELLYRGEVSFKVASVTVEGEPERLCRTCGHCSIVHEECGAVDGKPLSDIDRTLDSPACGEWMGRESTTPIARPVKRAG